MAVRAAGWALLGALFAGVAVAADAPATQSASDSLPVADSFPVATDARLGGDASQTRFVMDLDRKIDLHVFTLADPYRVVVDIPQVRFQLPPNTGESGRGLIKTFRYGLVMAGGSRVVLDVTKPVRVDKAFVVDAADGAPARLVLDLAATDRDSFLRKMALDDKLVRANNPPVSVPSGGPQSDSNDPRPLVVLDPGHGGIDTGTKASSGEAEKDIVLEVARRLRDRIEKTGKYRVLMTRDDDTFIPLADRVRIARNAGGALFVSIHADSLPRKEGDAQGATVYTLSETATDPAAARLAEEENRADVIAGVDLKSEPDDVAGILIDLAQRETKTYSVQFAHKLVGEMRDTARLHKEPIKSAGFRVLRAPDIPSVLVELGYVSNKQDLQSLLSDAWRDHTADCMARAIEGYFSTHVAGARAGAN
ncbi:MAG TPA: N-acetylmuramoyl-L-alanine amidase [Xanthobacteraceae bacterium]|jgi:N-acetylmuramoyl-L-alanine amidase|nr:N-acetylmuramoyl-L-alanine amidase [Xanthobacteraceae bacterium]